MSSITINIHGPATITAAEATPSAPALPVPKTERISQGSLRAELCDVLQMDDDATDESLIRVSRLNVVSTMVLNSVALALGYEGDDDEPVVDLVKDLKRERDELRGQVEAIAKAIGFDGSEGCTLPEAVRGLYEQAERDDQEVIALKKQIAEGQKERTMIAAALRLPMDDDSAGLKGLLEHAQRIGGESIRWESERKDLKGALNDSQTVVETLTSQLEDARREAHEQTIRADEYHADLTKTAAEAATLREQLAAAQASPSGVDARQLPDEPRQEPAPGSPDSAKPAQRLYTGETVIYTWPSGEHFALCKVLAYNPEQKTYELTDGSSRMGNIPASSIRAADEFEIKRLRDAGLLPPEGEQEEKTKRRRRTKAEIEAEKAQAEAEQQPQEPAAEPQETPVVAEDQTPGTGIECREWLKTFLAANPSATIGSVYDEAMGRFTTEQIEWQLKHLAGEGVIVMCGAADSSPVYLAAPAQAS